MATHTTFKRGKGSECYDGYAAEFDTNRGGEFIIMAPDISTLASVIKLNNIIVEGNNLDVDRCRHVRMMRSPLKDEAINGKV